MNLTGSCKLPTGHGEFTLWCFSDASWESEHLALTVGEPRDSRHTLVRIHSECLTSEVFGSQRCDCREQLSYSMRKIADAGVGLLIYLRQEGRGIGIDKKIQAYGLQDKGLDTVDANLALGLPVDARSFNPATAIIEWFELSEIVLMTNNPAKLGAVRASRTINSVTRIPCEVPTTPLAEQYLKAKRDRLGHMLGMTQAG